MIFAIKDMGEPKEFLRIKIERDIQNQTLKLSLEKFVNNMLEKYARSTRINFPRVYRRIVNKKCAHFD